MCGGCCHLAVAHNAPLSLQTLNILLGCREKTELYRSNADRKVAEKECRVLGAECPVMSSVWGEGRTWERSVPGMRRAGVTVSSGSGARALSVHSFLLCWAPHTACYRKSWAPPSMEPPSVRRSALHPRLGVAASMKSDRPVQCLHVLLICHLGRPLLCTPIILSQILFFFWLFHLKNWH